MPAFRRVDARNAGATALGILVPPGATTLVILRPRGLEWALLPARWQRDVERAPEFCQFTRDEAALVAQRLPQTLEGAVAAGENPVQSFGKSDQIQLWVRGGDYVWILCRRRPGQPYEPVVFASQDDAASTGCRLEPYLFPAPGANQQFYFNTQSFIPFSVSGS